MSNVIVVSKTRVNVNTVSAVPVTLKNLPTIGSGNRIDRLLDVDASAEANGSTLVYDSANDKYVVKKLDLSEVTGNLDGGEF